MIKVHLKVGIIFCLSQLALGAAFATDVGSPDPKMASKLYPGTTYSPYANQDFPNKVFWGETHVHTSLSMDASLMGATLGHEDAYRFARGEQVTSSTGLPFKMGRALDWLVVTDHSDLMGFADDLKAGKPSVLANPKGKYWYGEISKGGRDALEATLDLVQNWGAGTLPQDLVDTYSPGSNVYDSIWLKTTALADEYNDPGKFTTLIGYEWTSMPNGNNMHRNVIFRDGADVARQMMPMTTQLPIGSTDEEDLYKWMEEFTNKTGGSIFTLAHNGNISNGNMFPTTRTYAGNKVDKEYVANRAKWELLYEVTQIKGDGETHPALSSSDEFADFGTWDSGNLDLTTAKKPDMLQREYAREALKQGLKLEKKFGVNPYKFGMVGATDTHTGLAAVEEDNFISKSSSVEPNPDRLHHDFVKTENGVYPGHILQSGGYQGVWASENTREAIWDAMARKETYATTGPRMTVRLFGGFDFDKDDLRNRTPAHIGYRKGVPMGGDLGAANGKSPSFMVYALRDPDGANLDRIQIIKGWMDKKGKLHEKVNDVAWSDNRKINSKGKLPAVGNTVDIEAATWTNTIGASELATVWTDPDFDEKEKAFYYARILEIPTPRWVLYDQLRFGTKPPKDAKLTHQERAYTSPIWYSPDK